MFAAAKNGNVFSKKVQMQDVIFDDFRSFKKLRKNKQKNIVRMKKGFYICTPLTKL